MKIIIMNDYQYITWHYVMDIHEPEDYWYSLSRMKND